MKKEFLIISSYQAKNHDSLKANFNNINFTFKKRSELKKEDVKNKEVIVGNLPMDLLKEATSLKWLQLMSSGVGLYSKIGTLEKDVILTSATGAYGPGVAEHGLAMLLSLLKNINIYRDNQKSNLWQPMGSAKTLYNQNVLILGLGDIGQTFAEQISPFTKNVIGLNRSGKKHPTIETYTIDRLDDFIGESDIVFMSLPETDETKNILNENRIKNLKKGSVLINVGRGNSVDTNSLYTALKEKNIHGAGLDVTDPEPLPADHPLWTLENIIITPHVSGGFHTDITRTLFYELLEENIKNYLNDSPLKSLVKKGEAYAS